MIVKALLCLVLGLLSGMSLAAVVLVILGACDDKEEDEQG